MQGLAGGEDCKDEDLRGKQSPYIVNAGDDIRADLEAAMNDGVVIVRYSCDSIEIIDDCQLEGGSYGYSKITKKTKVLEMKDAASAQANLGGDIGGDIQAEFEMGRSLYLQYAWIGKRKTTVRSIKRGELVGSECGGATHYVRGADVGAFVMQMASAAEVGSQAEFFGKGGSVTTSASNSSRISDGDHTQCDGSGKVPPQGCSAIIRLALKPISDAAGGAVVAQSKGVEAEVGCREGFVINNDGICVRKAEAQVFMCEEGNFTQCDAQCTKGSVQSCGRLASIIMATVDEPEKLEEIFGGDEDKFFAFLVRNADAFKAACGEGEANACTMAGFGILVPMMQSGQPEASLAGPAMELLQEGCRGGEPFSCELMQEVMVDGDPEARAQFGITGGPLEFFGILTDSCSAGNGKACLVLSGEYVIGDHLRTDAQKAAEYAAQACYGGVANSCMMSAAMQLGEEICNESMQEFATESGASESKREKMVRERICGVAGPLKVDPNNPAALRPVVVSALGFLKRGCDLGLKKACEEHAEGQELLKQLQ